MSQKKTNPQSSILKKDPKLEHLNVVKDYSIYVKIS